MREHRGASVAPATARDAPRCTAAAGNLELRWSVGRLDRILPPCPPPPVPTTADLNRILAEHAPHIEAVVRRYADEPMDRDDLRQEIAIAIWRAMPRFAGRASER